MSLLAQTEFSTIERLLENYGLSTLLVVMIGVLCWKVMPRLGEKLASWVNRLVEAAVDFINKMAHNYDCLSNNVKENTEVMKQMGGTIAQKMDPKGDPAFNKHIFSTIGTNQSILSLSRAARPFCEGLPEQQKQLVLRHLDDIERLLGGQS